MLAPANAHPLTTEDREQVSLAITGYFNPSTLFAPTHAEGLSTVIVKGENSGTGGPPQDPPAGTRTYAVQKGDNLSRIATSFGLPGATLLAANPAIRNTNVIEPGQVLIIPPTAVTDEEAAKARQQNPVKPQAQKPTSSARLDFTTYNSTSTAVKSDDSYAVPVAYTYESQGFRASHPGIDMVAPLGTPVHATKSGCIISAGGGWNGGYGTLVTQDLGDGYSARYAHLTAIASGVKSGACLEQGDLIGYVGSTGNSTGPHLHFELRLNGVAFNPAM